MPIQRWTHRMRAHGLAVVVFLLGLISQPAVAEDLPIRIVHPLPYQVIQRVGFDPATAMTAEPGSAAYGSAEVVVSGTLPEATPRPNALEFRVVLADGSEKLALDWGLVVLGSTKLKELDFRFTVTVPAGGWYRLEVRSVDGVISQRAVGSVEPFGVGEVFLVAGQSYATNTNEERLRVADKAGRVVAYDSSRSTWAVAHDPQPAPDGSDGGSIWPPLGDALRNELHVPIGFANIAVGGTSSAQWMPGSELHQGLIAAGKSLGRFRAVLWQQGESDVIAKTPVETYIANLKSIRKAAVRVWGFEPVWLAAKSTLHPTVYNDPDGEGRIREALERVSLLPGFGAGPDTDTLTGDSRGDAKSRRHFSAIGQRRAAELWQSVLLDRLRKTPTGIEAASFLLPDLHLLEPAWSSETVYRESAILRRSSANNDVAAELAFPPTDILSITAAGRQLLPLENQFARVSGGLTTMHFEKPESIAVIDDADMFPAADSPNSYKHRVGHPEQNLLYRPGRWFHDRNVEITYRRDLAAQPDSFANPLYGSLPKTVARLKAGEPITLGISGDSISTGADASAVSAAAPFQPGYPDLVAAQLQVLSDSDIVLKNRAVGGWSVANGVADMDSLLAEKPNLIIVAYGMNDVGRQDPKWFGEQTRTIIERVKAINAETEILLVSPMLGNKEWIHTPREMFPLYRDELKALVAPGVALADVTAVWELLLQRKHDLDLTGNGLNHPNDFGHRLYAQAVLGLLQP